MWAVEAVTKQPRAAVPGEIKIEAPSTDKDADAVVHPGALAYLNDSEKSFFDKYGDARDPWHKRT
ncbi:MAG: hypothetical protein WA728_26400 [Xanthobacteraceae bacterium]